MSFTLALWGPLILQVVVFLASALIYTVHTIKGRYTAPGPEDMPVEPMTFVIIVARLSVAEVEDVTAYLELNDAAHEIIFCAESADEPVAIALSQQFSGHSHPCRIIYGAQGTGPNHKADMMALGFAAAHHDIVAFVDGNTKIGQALDQRIAAAWKGTDCLVSTMPCADTPRDVWTGAEAALLDRIYARWMISGTYFGLPFAFGKLLVFRKSWLQRHGGTDRLFEKRAEDTALSSLAWENKIPLCHVSPPVIVSNAARTPRDFRARSGRWTKLRRSDLPTVFVAEVFYTLWSMLTLGALTAWITGASVLLLLLALTLFWHALEALMAFGATSKWRLAIHGHAALRDILMPVWWCSALINPNFIWRAPSGVLSHDLKPDKTDKP